MQTLENNEEQGEIVFEDNTLNREEFPLVFAVKKILDFYFGEISLNTILSFSAKSNQGFTQELAIDVIKEVGLIAVLKDIKATDIPSHFLPCIIFDEKQNPFILKRKGKETLIYDPIKNIDINTNDRNSFDNGISLRIAYNKNLTLTDEENKIIEKFKKETKYYKNSLLNYIEVGSAQVKPTYIHRYTY